MTPVQRNGAVHTSPRPAPTMAEIYSVMEHQAVGRSLRDRHHEVARRRTVELLGYIDAVIGEGDPDA